MLVLLVALLLARMVVLIGLAGGVFEGVFSTDQGIDEIGALQHRFLRRAPENRPRVPGLVEALAVFAGIIAVF